LLLAGGGFLLISLDSLGLRLADTSPWNATFWLGVFTYLAMAVVVPLRTGRSLPRVAIEGGTPMAASSLLQAGSITFFVLAISHTTVANTVAIIAAAPVMAALISLVAIGEQTRLRTWVGIIASIVGILIIVSGSLGQGRLSGDLFAVGAITAFASNLTLLRRYQELNRLAVIGGGGLFLALVALGPAEPLETGPGSIAILAVLGAATGATGRTGVITSTRYLPPAQVSLFAPIETIAATTWAWLFLSETPPLLTIVGGLIVVAAVVYGTTGQSSEATGDLATAP
jgi:drug/metabolite transporter (DMT)-like permease